MGASLKHAEPYMAMRAYRASTRVFSNEILLILLVFLHFFENFEIFWFFIEKIGYKVTAAATPIFHSLFFAIYNYAKIFNRKLLPNQSENYLLINSLSSSIAGLLCNCITNPLWVISSYFSFIFHIISPFFFDFFSFFAFLMKK